MVIRQKYRLFQHATAAVAAASILKFMKSGMIIEFFGLMEPYTVGWADPYVVSVVAYAATIRFTGILYRVVTGRMVAHARNLRNSFGRNSGS